MDIANDIDTAPEVEPTGMAMATKNGVRGAPKPKEKEVTTHLSSEEEIEREKSMLMRRLRKLRAECESLEGQLDQARQTRQATLDVQEKARNNVDSTMYTPLFRGGN